MYDSPRYEEGITLVCYLPPDEAAVPASTAHLCLESRLSGEK